MTNEIISFDDLRKVLNVTGNKLTRLTQQGLPCVLLGDGRKVFLTASVTEWLRAKEVKHDDTLA